MPTGEPKGMNQGQGYQPRPPTLPLDVWQLIVGTLDAADAMRVFDNLWEAGIFDGCRRLDAFWGVIASARERGWSEPDVMQNPPDPEPFRAGHTQLVEMGLSSDYATRIMRDARGSWETALRILRWD
tara:strand:+ start:1288 stop:1668 length:381 start_codon:yes stop_codon:yes gene_type:complete